VIPIPQLLVVKRIVGVKKLEVRGNSRIQVVYIKQFKKSLFGVRFKIPQGMIEIEKEVFVRHKMYTFRKAAKFIRWCLTFGRKGKW